MALTADFYNFSKRQNSTKVPASAGTSFNITLKQPTSLNSPVFVLNNGSFNYNYCSFNGAYYFVSDVVSLRNDIWEVHCTKDVLATYRTQILASTAYVLYDNAANTDIVDNRLAVESSYTTSYAQTEITQLDGSGVYALCVIGANSTDTWIIADTDDLMNLLTTNFDAIFSPQVPPTQPTIMEQLKETIVYLNAVIGNIFASGSAPDCVRSCYWMPWNIDGDSGVEQIRLGNFLTGQYGKRVITNTLLMTYSVTIPWQTNDWRRLSPFTQVYLYLPFIGVINIPSASILNYSALTVEYALSKRTGELSVIVSADNGNHIIGVYQGTSSTNIPIGKSAATPAAKATALLAAAGATASVVSGAGFAGAAALTGIMGSMSSLMAGSPSCIGGNSGGSDAALPRYIQCITVLHDTNVNPSSVAGVIGTPTFAPKVLSSVSGYVQTHEFSLQADAPDVDLQRVNTYLNGGAFIE